MGGGVSILTVLALIFIVLKLVGLIDWSWWWVLAPFWIPLAFALVIVAIVFVVWLIAAVIEYAKEEMQ